MLKRTCTAIIASFFFFTAAFATDSAPASQDLFSAVKQLQAQIVKLETHITDLDDQMQSVQDDLIFERILKKGMTGDNVRKLQEFLGNFPDIYPGGLVTGFFGPLTQTAVQKFRERNDDGSAGVVGPKPQLTATPAEQSNAALSNPASVSSAPQSAPPKALPATSLPPATPAVPTIPATSGSAGNNPSSPSPAARTTTSDTTAPSTPINLSASAVSSSQINLAWPISADNVGVVGYTAYRDGVQIATGITPTSTIAAYSDTGLRSSTAYAYTVAAYDAAGNTSPQSASASATTNSPPLPISTPPDAPIISSITPYIPIPLNQHFVSSVTLQWNAVANPSSYLTYYKAWRKSGNGEWLYWANTQQTTFPDLNIGRGTYSYRVNACHTTTGSPLVLATDVCGPDSNIMTATLVGGGDASDTTLPSTPTGITVSIVNSDSPYISWAASTDNVGVAGYNIYRNGTYLMSVIGTATIDDTVSRSTTSRYAVAAYDAAGNESAQSSPVSVASLSIKTTSSIANVLESLRSLPAILQRIKKLFR